MIFILIIGLILLGGLFNPWTGLFGNTLYSPKNPQKEPEKVEPKHSSFRMTRGD